eukprot:s6124_g5.t1
MLKAVLNLKTVDPESFGKEYLEQSLRAADALMEELDTADPELPKFGQPKIGAKTGDGPRRGRKADRELPDEPQRSRSGRQQRSATPSRRTARSATPARSSWQAGGEEHYDWREYQRRKREAAEERESGLRRERQDTGHVKCRQDLLDLGIDPNLPSEITSQCTVRHHADYVAPTVPNEMKAWYQSVFIRRSENTAWEWRSRWLWPGTRVDFGDTVYRVATFMVPHGMSVSPLSLASSNWLTQLVTEQKGCVLVLDEMGSRRQDLKVLSISADVSVMVALSNVLTARLQDA